jgi:hypothetical protein
LPTSAAGLRQRTFDVEGSRRSIGCVTSADPGTTCSHRSGSDNDCAGTHTVTWTTAVSARLVKVVDASALAVTPSVTVLANKRQLVKVRPTRRNMLEGSGTRLSA